MKFSFETAMERLGRILARQYHIQVVYEGDQAHTNGKTITLPQVKEMTEELWADLNGYLDHEVAHCKFTKFDEMGLASGKMHRELLNMCEDVRIEREMINEFPGCALNLEPLNAKLKTNLFKPENWAKLPWPVRLTIGIGEIMLGKAPKIDPDTERYFTAVNAKANELNDCTNTTEIRIKTKEIIDLINEEREEEKKEEKKEEKSKEKGEKSEGGSKGEEKSEKSDGESSEGEGEESEGDSSDDGSEGGESESEGEGESEASKPGKSKPGKSGKPSGETAEDKMLKDGLGDKSAWDDQVLNVGDMINDELADHIKKEGKPSKPGEYKGGFEGSREFDSTPHIASTTRFDTVTDHSGKGSPTEYAKLKREVAPMLNPIKQTLERILKVQENAKVKTERERGGINARSLGRMASDKTYRTVFKEHTRTETNNVAVELLIDMSGSMGGSKIHNAKLTAIALGEALKSLEIPFEVTGFFSEYDRKVASSGVKPDSRYNRTTEALRLHVFKDFGAQSMTGMEKLFVGSQNPDGECVAWAAKRLANRKEKRKILIVLSDGMPATGDGSGSRLNADLKSKVEKIQKSGIECIGIGIQSDAVSRFYKDHVVLGNVKELPKTVLTKLSSLITKGARMR